jgi:hypothetical protein
MDNYYNDSIKKLMLDNLFTLNKSLNIPLDLEEKYFENDKNDNSDIIRKITSAAENLVKRTFVSEITDVSSLNNCTTMRPQLQKLISTFDKEKSLEIEKNNHFMRILKYINYLISQKEWVSPDPIKSESEDKKFQNLISKFENLKSLENEKNKHFMRIFKYIDYLTNQRNWVSHEGRKSGSDDVIECIRSLNEFLGWHVKYYKNTYWRMSTKVEGLRIIEKENHEKLYVPQSVEKLKNSFETFYNTKNYNKLIECFSVDYVGSLYNEKNWNEIIDIIKNFHNYSKNKSIKIVMEILTSEITNDGTIWWETNFIVKIDDIKIEDKSVFVRLTDLKKEIAKIIQIKKEI